MGFQVERKRWLGGSSHAIVDRPLIGVNYGQARSELETNAINMIKHVFATRDAELEIHTNGLDFLNVTVVTPGKRGDSDVEVTSVYEFSIKEDGQF